MLNTVNRRAGVRCSLSLFCSIAALATADMAYAQDVQDGQHEPGFGEIVVTAQRRAQAVSDIPIAVTALGGAELERAGIQNTQDLTYIAPNMRMSTFYPGRAEISIRGVAMSESFLSTDQQPVGVYQEEVFQGSRLVHMSQLFDLERVEIVRGPQGVLFGRNTTAGALSFYAKKPEDEFGGYASFGYGNYDAFVLEGAVNVPLGGGFSARVSGNYKQDDGWARNVFTGARIMDSSSRGLRGILQYEGAATTWILNVHESRYNGDVNYYFSSDIPGYAFNELGQRSPEAPEVIDAFGSSLTGTFSIGDVDVTSITAYEESQYFAYEDFGHGPTDINNAGQFAQFNPFMIGYTDDFYQVSQEFRFAGSLGRLEWVAGVFGYYEKVNSTYSDGAYGRGTIGLDFNENGVIDVPDEGWFPEDDSRIWKQTTKEAAIFAHGNYALSDQFSILGGLRYTYSKKELDWQYTDMLSGFDYVPKTHLQKSWNSLTARAGVEYRPNTDILLYGRYDRGFKNGGFNVGGSNAASLAIVDPEKVDAFEVGGKFTFLDGRAQLNTAVFLTKIRDYQANLNVVTTSGLGFAFQNAAKVESKGFELELNMEPVDDLKLSGSFGYTDSKFKEYYDPISDTDYSGNYIPNTPKYSLAASAEYTFTLPGDYRIIPRADYSYTSRMQSRHYNRPYESYDPRNLVNAQLAFIFPGEVLSVTGWVKNLTNLKYWTKIIGEPQFAGGLMEKRGTPRTYGLTLRSTW